MTMNTKNLFCAAAIMLGTVFTACTSDISDIKQDDKPAIDDGAKVYLNIDLSMATGGLTRSQTGTDGGSSDGTETGQLNENTISNVMVLLVGLDKDGNDKCFIAKWTKDLTSSPIEIKDPQTLTADFNRSAFLDHYEAHKNEDDNNNKNRVAVYVICNYTNAIDALVGNAGPLAGNIDKWVKNGIVGTQDNGSDYTKSTMPYWQDNKFLMSNASRYESYIPTKEKIEEGKDYNSPGNAFNLTPNGAIEVERAVARFDYAPDIDDKDASGAKISQVKTETTTDGKTVYYYEVAIDGTNADGSVNTNAEKLKVYLKRMALVNMNRKFYLFRRVSKDGTPTPGESNNNEFLICGKERNNNFVVDPEWQFKKEFTNTTAVTEFEKRFFYYVGVRDIINADGIEVNNKWDNYEIDKILENTKYDNTYHFWRYVIPNTIPGTNIQKNGVSTGVVFKAKIEPADITKPIGSKMTLGYDIFSFKGKVLGSWKDVQNFATAENADPILKKAYNDAVAKAASLNLAEGADPKTLDDTETEAAVKTGGFAKYGVVNGAAGVDGQGYYCYYYYWNRHNDNGNPNQMGPMEFGVVRNNVYKLHVTSLKRLGHPFRPGNDPDPIKPETPDEETKLYMNLSVKVRPWTVRKNYVDF